MNLIFPDAHVLREEVDHLRSMGWSDERIAERLGLESFEWSKHLSRGHIPARTQQ